MRGSITGTLGVLYSSPAKALITCPFIAWVAVVEEGGVAPHQVDGKLLLLFGFSHVA